MTDLWLIDAFADAPFQGNPAGICWLDRPVPDHWMQSLAMELNQAETAFLRREGDGFRLRWFTPAAEVDLCGHATLASAHFLWTTGRLDAGTAARFMTRSGALTATRDPDATITLDFPATPPAPVAAPADLRPALGISGGEIFANQVAQRDYLVRLDDPAELLALTPDFGRLKRLDGRGVIVTSTGHRPGVDFLSRFFVPNFGIDEDPVTGSAHCTLAPFWTARLGRASLVGYQASRRGGTVGTTLVGDRVQLSGRAVVVLRGTIELPA